MLAWWVSAELIKKTGWAAQACTSAHSLAPPYGQAQRLALRCREDAARAGISSQDLEAAAEGNLTGNMLQALDDAEFRQMYRDQLAGQAED